MQSCCLAISIYWKAPFPINFFSLRNNLEFRANIFSPFVSVFCPSPKECSPCFEEIAVRVLQFARASLPAQAIALNYFELHVKSKQIKSSI